MMLWDLRNKHIIDHGPRKYVFHLACCYEEGCIHPLCKQGRPDDMDESMLWFPGGPPLTFLPFPMPDGDRRPGSCPDHECCGGHFLPPREVIEKRLKGVQLPPSDVLQKAHTDGSTDEALLSTECTLPVEEVNIWLDHLRTVTANRERGKAKAAETRSLKKKDQRKKTETHEPQATPSRQAANHNATQATPSRQAANHNATQATPSRQAATSANHNSTQAAPSRQATTSANHNSTQATPSTESAPDNIVVELSRFGRKRKRRMFSEFVM